MGNTPWEPCPRCKSNRVKVDSVAGIRAGRAFILLVIVGFAIFLMWGLNAVPPNGLGSAVVGGLALGVVGIFAVPIILGAAFLLSFLFARGEGWIGTCQDCSYTWEIEEAEQNRPAPSNPQSR